MTDPSTGGAADGAARRAGPELTSLTTLVFDVLGTLLDEDGALAAAAAAACADRSDADPGEVVRDWADRETSLMAAVRDKRAAFETIDVLRGRALAATLTAFGITLAGADLDRLARAGHRLTPFPDTVVAFGRLAQERAMVALTNANQAMAFDMSRYAGLCWHTLLSAETVHTYKPDPRMYAYAIERLELDPGQALFVAAHPWDLDAAATHGFRTAYLDRAGSSPAELAGYADRFDVVVPDLAGLAVALLGPA